MMRRFTPRFNSAVAKLCRSMCGCVALAIPATFASVASRRWKVLVQKSLTVGPGEQPARRADADPLAQHHQQLRGDRHVAVLVPLSVPNRQDRERGLELVTVIAIHPGVPFAEADRAEAVPTRQTLSSAGAADRSNPSACNALAFVISASAVGISLPYARTRLAAACRNERSGHVP